MGLIYSGLRIFALTLRSLLVLPVGLLSYQFSGRTPGYAHQALIWLFCVTRGRSNDVLSRLAAWIHPKVRIDTPIGVLGDLRGAELPDRVDALRRDGYLTFEAALPAAVCDRLLRFALQTKSTVRPMDGEANTVREEFFDLDHLVAVRYDYAASALLDNPDVQSLLADASILAMAQEYLGCQPFADVINMWWHTNFHDRPDAAAAQFYHFDMDRIRWLKVFVYLTDVGPENGPHSFIKGSHRSGGIPSHLLLRGYQRLTDEDVHGCFSREDCKEFSAPRGTIILEDTRGLHKGAHVRGAPRLVLQLQFSNDLFGARYSRARITQIGDPALQKMMLSAPQIYSQYT